jgi:hypothetical protein
MADRGVEVVTGSHSAAESVTVRRNSARIWPGRLSRGSDFHSPDESRTDLGTLPALAGSVDTCVGPCLQTAFSAAQT